MRKIQQPDYDWEFAIFPSSSQRDYRIERKFSEAVTTRETVRNLLRSHI